VNVIRQLRKLIEMRPIWLYFYLLKATISVLLVLPFYMTFNSYLAPSQFSQTIIGSWDMSVILELFSHSNNFVPSYIMMIIIGAIIFMALMQFLNGGLYFIIVSGKSNKINWSDFFGECGINFGTHIKITLLMGLVYMILIPAGMFFINAISMAGGTLMGQAALYLTLFKLLVMVLILLAASTFSDIARAASAAFPEKGFGEILKIAADYFRPRMFKLVKVFIITWLPFFLVWLAVESLALAVIGMSFGILGVVLEFFLFQVSAITRTGQKLWYLIIVGHEFRKINPGRFLPEQVEINFENKMPG
jgi:hypothetical protein